MNDKFITIYNNETLIPISVLKNFNFKHDLFKYVSNRFKSIGIDNLSYKISDFENNDGMLHKFEKTDKDEIVIHFNNIKDAYEFHIIFNTYCLTDIYSIKHLDYKSLNPNPEVIKETYDNNLKINKLNTIDKLAKDIKDYDMYFPFIGYYDSNTFIVTEGLHRTNAIQLIGGNYMCIHKNDKTKFDRYNDKYIETFYFYKYIGKNTFIRMTTNRLEEPIRQYVANNVNINTEIFKLENRFNGLDIISNESVWKNEVYDKFTNRLTITE